MSSEQKKTKGIDTNPFPNRHDSIYTNIENIEDFEFTHSIVYQFARRNENIQNILNFLNDLFALYEGFIHKRLDEYNKYILKNNFKEDENIKKAEELINPIINEHLSEIVKFHNQKELKEELEGLSIKNVKEKFCNIIKLLTDKLYNDYYIIYTTEFPSLFKNINDIYNPTTNLERDKLLTEIVNNLDLDDCKYNIKNNDFFDIFQIITNYKKEIKLNIIYPKYKTAIRDFTDVKIALNLNLPVNEIIDFIKKIKDDYNSKNSIIKTPLELFGEKLGIDTDYKNTKRKKEWVDLLFIYDYYLIGIKNNKKKMNIENEIQLIFTKIYGVKVMRDTKTVKKDSIIDPKEGETEKPNKFDLIPYKEFLKKNEIEESDLNLNETADEKHYCTTRSIRGKYSEMKKLILGNNPEYKTLIYR